MNKKQSNREKILDRPSYWIEGVNGMLYDNLVEFMEMNKMNNTDLAQFLGISKGRVSQILNDGEINFSIEKLFEIVLKIGKYPVLELKDKQDYLKIKKDIKHFTFHIYLSYTENLTSYPKSENLTGFSAHRNYQKQLIFN